MLRRCWLALAKEAIYGPMTAVLFQWLDDNIMWSGVLGVPILRH